MRGCRVVGECFFLVLFFSFECRIVYSHLSFFVVSGLVAGLLVALYFSWQITVS